MGDAFIEVTQPRFPLFKLGLKMGMAKLPKLLSAGEWVTFICASSKKVRSVWS